MCSCRSSIGVRKRIDTVQYLIDVKDVRSVSHGGGHAADWLQDPALDPADEVHVGLAVLLAPGCVDQEVEAVLHPVDTERDLKQVLKASELKLIYIFI